MKLMLLSASLLVAACAATPGMKPSAASAGPMIAANDPFPPAKSGLNLAGDKEQMLTLENVLAQFERVTGVHLVTTPDIQPLLAKATAGLSSPLDVPAGRVYPTVETLLVQNGFFLTLLTTEAPILVGVESAEANKSLRHAWIVSPDDLPIVAQHPALLVSTVVTLPNTNIRDLSNTMRQVFQDPRTQQVVPVGQSSSMLITGKGSEIAALVRVLKSVDAEEGRAQAASTSGDAHSSRAKSDEPSPK